MANEFSYSGYHENGYTYRKMGTLTAKWVHLPQTVLFFLLKMLGRNNYLLQANLSPVTVT